MQKETAPPVKDRILAAMLPYSGIDFLVQAPYQVSQDGIAQAILATRPHISMAMSELIQAGLVNESLAHVEGKSRRVKCYTLTSKGYRKAREITQEIALRQIAQADGSHANLGEMAATRGLNVIEAWVMFEAKVGSEEPVKVPDGTAATSHPDIQKDTTESQVELTSGHPEESRSKEVIQDAIILPASPPQQEYRKEPSSFIKYTPPHPYSALPPETIRFREFQPTWYYPKVVDPYWYMRSNFQKVYGKPPYSTPIQVSEAKGSIIIGILLLAMTFGFILMGLWGYFFGGELCCLSSFALLIVSITFLVIGFKRSWYVVKIRRNATIALVFLILGFTSILIGSIIEGTISFKSLVIWIVVTLISYFILLISRDISTLKRSTFAFVAATVLLGVSIPASLFEVVDFYMGIAWSLVGIGFAHIGQELRYDLEGSVGSESILMGIGLAIAVDGLLAGNYIGWSDRGPLHLAIVICWVLLGIWIVYLGTNKYADELMRILLWSIPLQIAAILIVFSGYLIRSSLYIESGILLSMALILGYPIAKKLLDWPNRYAVLVICLVILEAVAVTSALLL